MSGIDRNWGVLPNCGIGLRRRAVHHLRIATLGAPDYRMTIKAIMVDVDGVVVVHPDAHGWSAKLERDLGVPVARLRTAFFEQHWADVSHGRAALRDRLSPVLREIAPHLTTDKLVDYWFANDAHVNEALLGELAAIRANGIEVHLATVQEHERATYLWEQLDFRSRFDGLHYSAELGVAKPAIDFYRSIEARTGFRPKDLFLIDDMPANVDGAISAGWRAALWTSRDELSSLLAAQR